MRNAAALLIRLGTAVHFAGNLCAKPIAGRRRRRPVISVYRRVRPNESRSSTYLGLREPSTRHLMASPSICAVRAKVWSAVVHPDVLPAENLFVGHSTTQLRLALSPAAARVSSNCCPEVLSAFSAGIGNEFISATHVLGNVRGCDRTALVQTEQ